MTTTTLPMGVDDTDTTFTGNAHCERCARTGRFITGILNGKPVGPGGPCFRCGGKAWHSLKDRRRNLGYDRWSADKAIFRADLNRAT